MTQVAAWNRHVVGVESSERPIAALVARRERVRTVTFEETAELLRRAKAGDRGALDVLCDRYRPRLVRWAAGRIPRSIRTTLDTDDLVQEALTQTLTHLDTFEPRHAGAFGAYVRQALRNRIRDEIRRARVRPGQVDLTVDPADPEPSPLDVAVGREAHHRYEEALDRLDEDQRKAIVLRLEMRYTYQEIAAALGKPTPDAARMVINRALVRLAREMGHE